MNDRCRVILGDVREQLRLLEAESIDCVVTSPPYWGLRDYGHVGQIGLEPSFPEFLGKLTEVFREVQRVLKPTGTCWVNMGDCYTGNGGQFARESFLGHRPKPDASSGKRLVKTVPGLPPKSLIGQPWRLAFALQDDGWTLRSEIIWHKPSVMPESVSDRPTKAHEQIFLFTKSTRYWYDAEAIREPAQGERRNVVTGWDSGPGSHCPVEFNTPSRYEKQGMRAFNRLRQEAPVRDQAPIKHIAPSQRRGKGKYSEISESHSCKAEEWNGRDTRNARTVWTIASQGYPGAHFATFPIEIPRRCILAGCPEGGTVLDPFAGSGTTLEAALTLGRKSIGIELNPEYLPLIEQRLLSVTPSLFMEAS